MITIKRKMRRMTRSYNSEGDEMKKRRNDSTNSYIPYFPFAKWLDLRLRGELC